MENKSVKLKLKASQEPKYTCLSHTASSGRSNSPVASLLAASEKETPAPGVLVSRGSIP